MRPGSADADAGAGVDRGPPMSHEAKHDLREDAVDAAVVATILLVITSIAVAAVRFALS